MSWDEKPDLAMTINDLPLNEELTRAAQLLPIISNMVTNGHLRAAAQRASDLHAVTRKIDWRLNELLRKDTP